MKILIIGPLGAGKSSLAYAINKKFDIPRLNLDEICRRPVDGSYYSREEQFQKLQSFLMNIKIGSRKDVKNIYMKQWHLILLLI